MTRKPRRVKASTGRQRPPRALFPYAVALCAAALIYEGDGRPALYVCVNVRAGLPALFRVPEDARVRVVCPDPLPDAPGRVFLPAGSRVVFETPDAVSSLDLHAVRVCRELLEALESYAHARQSWQEARRTFEGPDHAKRAG